MSFVGFIDLLTQQKFKKNLVIVMSDEIFKYEVIIWFVTI